MLPNHLIVSVVQTITVPWTLKVLLHKVKFFRRCHITWKSSVVVLKTPEANLKCKDRFYFCGNTLKALGLYFRVGIYVVKWVHGDISHEKDWKPLLISPVLHFLVPSWCNIYLFVYLWSFMKSEWRFLKGRFWTFYGGVSLKFNLNGRFIWDTLLQNGP